VPLSRGRIDGAEESFTTRVTQQSGYPEALKSEGPSRDDADSGTLRLSLEKEAAREKASDARSSEPWGSHAYYKYVEEPRGEGRQSRWTFNRAAPLGSHFP
jgi:hypothetical protein